MRRLHTEVGAMIYLVRPVVGRKMVLADTFHYVRRYMYLRTLC